MLKKISMILSISLFLIGISGHVMAKESYTTTSNISGVTVNWEYELNDSNEIENLKCKNATELTGNITIPSNLDGKTVVTLGNDAFKSATTITEIKIPNTVKEIGLWAFKSCSSLKKNHNIR